MAVTKSRLHAALAEPQQHLMVEFLGTSGVQWTSSLRHGSSEQTIELNRSI